MTNTQGELIRKSLLTRVNTVSLHEYLNQLPNI